MKRWSMILGCALALFGAACTSGDGEGDGGVAGFLGTTGGVGAGSGGTGGSHAGSGGTGATGHAGQEGGTSPIAGTTGGAGIGVSGGEGGAGSGGSSGTGGASGEGGQSGEGGDGGTSGMACGSRGLPECTDGSYCDYPDEADCGRADAPGACRPLTDVACGEIWSPVCGCDGTTYSSSCHAQQAGMSIDHIGECDQVGPPPGYQCAVTGATCFIAPPACPEGQVPAVEGMCFGDCVPIEACECDGPEDCPSPETYTCHLSAGHCGPYTN